MLKFWARRRSASHKHAKRTICNNCRDEIGPDIHLVTTKRGLLGSPGRCHKILGPFTKGIIIGDIYQDYDTDPRPAEPVQIARRGALGRRVTDDPAEEAPHSPGTDPYSKVEEALQEIESEA